MYTGVKSFIETFKKPFDRVGKATKIAKQRLKDNGIRATKEAVSKEMEVVYAEWDEKAQKGIRIHNKIHERELSQNENCIMSSYEKFEGENELDAESENKLENGMTYLEKKVVSNHHHLLGYADKVKVERNFINIEDFKTYEHLYRSSSYITKTGYKVPATYFFHPISGLQDCNFNEAALQLSIYLYILWTHNKKLKPGKLTIRHIKTNEEDKIIGEEVIEVPYLLEQVKAMFKHKRANAK